MAFSDYLTRLKDRTAGILGLDTRSGALNAMIRTPAIIGGLILFLFFGVFGGWAATAPLTGGAVAPGLVSPDGSRRVVQHFEGGIIDTFAVSDGDLVTVGDPLLTLRDTQAKASYDVVRGQYLVMSAMLARLFAEQSGAEEIAWPPELLADRDDPQVSRILEAQQMLFETRKENLDGQSQILRQRVAQLDEEIIGLEAVIESQSRQLALINDELKSVRQLVEKGLARKPRLLELERTAAEIQGARANNRASVARAKQKIGETELQIMNLESRRLDEVANQLTEVRAELSELEDRMLAARDVLDRVIIRAPVSGTVVNKRFATVGGVVRPGDPILDIVPDEEDLLIDARVSPIDIDIVREDLEAQIYLSAFAQRNLPQIHGRVRSVSADALEDPQTGERYYTARVEVDRAQLDEIAARTGEEIALYPGMPAEVLIVTGQRTMLAYLFEPFSDSLRRSFR